MGHSLLDGQRAALWGWGREGKATHRALRSAPVAGGGIRYPGELTLFCNAQEAEDARALGDPLLRIEAEVDGERLSAFDMVIKSPGISPYSPMARAAQASGTRFVGATQLWFAERRDADTLCVTGTKGKSTTTAMLAHLLRAAGKRTALVGNIGAPLMELIDGQADVWAIELSSYQTRDVADSGVRPHLAIVTNIYPEHLDWHGGEDRYVADKLALVTEGKPHVAVLNAADPILARMQLPDSEVVWFNHADGWHMQGEVIHRGDEAIFDTSTLPLPGAHNRGNLCAVLAALEAIGFDAAAFAPHAATFQPLPNRLQALGERDGILYVNDSISTTPHATLAALDLYRDRPVAVLVGGHDRGLDWHDFAEAMRSCAPHAIVTMGQNGPRIHALLEPIAAAGGFTLSQARDLEDAMRIGRDAIQGNGVMLLSPGAPSFGPYRDYVARGRHFAELAGFDPGKISAIQGMGIS
ncbi:UDP-N-acetylmuramoyl-L-alanine--D-glutamate ligase [Solilutibacter silvestris]|uniref:UDP-N-acetylmuramoyl-L-alanine--D-glutamate ligase n=1 Tax=Solilutibacter silvestris TaxID=1645665 RepID=UPI000CA038A3|nr:UDP-N-acetylmuramoyl-L-alanine--D-glutamate ligase [Lysobacter silvestris]